MSSRTPKAELDSRPRLQALARTELLNADRDPGMDKITKLASLTIRCDVSLINFVESDSQFCVSAYGLPDPFASERQTPLSHSFCQHVVLAKKPLVVEDARLHDLVSSNLAITDHEVISYLGVPIEYHGQTIGALCAVNRTPRKWIENEMEIIQGFADLIEHEIDVRLYASRAHDLAQQNALLVSEWHHRVKNSLAVAGALISLSGREATSVTDLVTKSNGRLSALANAHDALLSDVLSVALGDLAAKLLLPYTAERSNVTISGPNIELAQEQVTPPCLILHELATNSAKYGALGQNGSVSLTWAVSSDQIVLTWNEVVASGPVGDVHAGFGSLLIKTATAQLSGGTTLEWSASGLQIVVTFPLQRVIKR